MYLGTLVRNTHNKHSKKKKKQVLQVKNLKYNVEIYNKNMQNISVFKMKRMGCAKLETKSSTSQKKYKSPANFFFMYNLNCVSMWSVFLDTLVCFLFLIMATKINHQKTEWWHFHILPFSMDTCDFIHDLEYSGKPHMTYLLWKMLKPLLYAWWKISSEADL